MTKLNEIKTLLGFTKPYWKKVALATILLFFGSALSATPPLLIRQLIDNALPQEDFYLFITIIAGIFLVPIITALVQWGQYYFSTVVGYRIMLDLRSEMFDKVLRLPAKFFDEKATGEVLSRINNDTSSIQSLIGSIIFPAIQLVSYLLILIPVTFVLNWKLALIGLAMYPLTILPSNLIVKKMRPIQQKTRQQGSELNAFVSETLSGVKTIKTFVREERETDTYIRKNKDFIKLSIKGSTLEWLNSIILNNMVSGLTSAIVYSFGVWSIVNGNFTVGGLIAFAAYLPGIYAGITQITRINAAIQSQMVSIERVNEYKDQVSESQAGQSIDIKGKVEFENVRFKYNKDSKYVLDDVSLKINPKEFIAFVGPSGAGKTTIVDLLMGFYPADEGEIKLDNRQLEALSPHSIRKQIGFVSQDLFLFNRSIRENISYGVDNVDLNDIITAAKMADIHDRILELPDQYDTVVGERGAKLSGGERQRLALARAILVKPKILILDEATSDLDALTEKAIQIAIESLKGDCTTIAIAHRLSTILKADRIYVMSDGKIIEQGTHKELVANKGLYSKLYETQFEAS